MASFGYGREFKSAVMLRGDRSCGGFDEGGRTYVATLLMAWKCKYGFVLIFYRFRTDAQERAEIATE